MSFCPYCGRQLQDNESCNCQAGAAINGGASPDVQPTFQAGSNPAMDFSGSSKPKNFLIPAIIAVVVVIVLIASVVSSSANAYKKPVDQFVKGFNSCKIEKVMESVYPDDYLDDMEELLEDLNFDWDDLMDEANDALKDEKKSLEDEYGKNVKLSIKILSKKKAKDSEIEDLEDSFYRDCDQEIKKAYKLKVKMTIKGKEDEESVKGSLYVVKFKKDGWHLCLNGEGLDLSDFADFSW